MILLLCFSGLNLNASVSKAVSLSGVSENDFLYSVARRMSSYLINSKSHGTCKTYYCYFQKWLKFANYNKLCAIPAQHIHVALYVTHLLDSGASSNVINASIYAIKWAHELNDFSDPTNNNFVNNLQESAKRIAHRKVNRKDPVSSGMLIELCRKYKDCNDLLVLRDLTMILFGFAGFLRYDEISSLFCKDVIIHNNYLTLKIKNSKTDQYRQGNEVLISKGDSDACPYSMYLRYINCAGVISDSSDYLFKPVFRSKGVAKLIYKNKKLSYTRTRESVVGRLREINCNLNLGLHSLRSGGATAAAHSGVNERCILRHGRWSTETSKNMYIVDSVQDRLSISQNLGL